MYKPETISSLPNTATLSINELHLTKENQPKEANTCTYTPVSQEHEIVKRVESKCVEQERKRKIVTHINECFTQNAAMSVLAEAESLASYSRKRLALSYEMPATPQRRKSHLPNEQNIAWDVNGAMLELRNFPLDQKINWSQMANKYEIPQHNAGQVLKEMALRYGIDIPSLEQKSNTTPRIRRRKCRLPGGEISTPCLPTVSTIKQEQRHLILTGELNIGEPCTPFQFTKSIITKEGNVEFNTVQICGRKIALYDIRVALFNKHENICAC